MTATTQSNGATSGLTLARIPDGTSNTLMLATRYADCGTGPAITAYSAGPAGGALYGSPQTSQGPPPSGTLKGGFFGAGLHTQPADRSNTSAIFLVAPKGTNSDCGDNTNSVWGHSFSTGGLSVALAGTPRSGRSIPNMSATHLLLRPVSQRRQLDAERLERTVKPMSRDAAFARRGHATPLSAERVWLSVLVAAGAMIHEPRSRGFFAKRS